MPTDGQYDRKSDVLELQTPTVAELLHLHGLIETELRRRTVTRSSNRPTGDYAELIVARAYEGVLEPQSRKAWDVIAGDLRLQVKARTRGATARTQKRQFSPIRSQGQEGLDFVFLTLEEATLDVLEATQVSSLAVQAALRSVPHVGITAGRIPAGQDVTNLKGANDVRSQLVEAARWLVTLDGTTAQQELAPYYRAQK